MISMIAAIGKNNELGRNNDLIWKLPNDLKFFKSVTSGKVVVMGRNTFWSLPGVLPNRVNVVISDVLEDYPDGVVVVNSIQEVIDNYDDFFVIGGAYVYSQFIDKADNLYLTLVDAECEDASVYFPTFDKSLYNCEILGENCDNGIKYKHVIYRRCDYER